MKKMIIGLLALASASAFSAPCTILIRGLNTDEIHKIKTSLPESKTRIDQNKKYDFGLLAIKKWIETDEINPFGEKIMKVERKFKLYENGNLLIETEFAGNSASQVEIIVDKLKTLRCE